MPTETSFPRIAIVDIAGKGRGVVAKEPIARGTLIVSEKPRILLPLSTPPDLSTLSLMDTSFFLSFPCGPNEHPILGHLKHFTPCVGDDMRGLCQTICRVNHTCYSPNAGPNAAYFWNVDTKEEELRAIKQIDDAQEIEVSYMEDIVNYEESWALLLRKYGFQCSCEGCVRPAAKRNANDFVRRFPRVSSWRTPHRILKDIETQILIICEEGYTGEAGPRANDVF
ncbi:hypothetical protein FB451DRAFT_445967 [Mycena latifolia]|nr:hypothetical protein FB451DRAFT_445967 [Mycena latifolia]